MNTSSVAIEKMDSAKCNNNTKVNDCEEKIEVNYVLSFEEANKLQINDKFDYYDTRFGQCYCVTILDKNNTKIKIHYDGYKSANDKWVDFSMELNRFAKYKSITSNLLLNHNYAKYFKLDEYGNNISILTETMQSCMKSIKNDIIPLVKLQSRYTVIAWVNFMYYYLYELFMSNKLKNVINDEEKYKKFVDIFNTTYHDLIHDICVGIDVKHLQIKKDLLATDSHPESQTKQFSKLANEEITKMKILWHAIHTKSNVQNDYQLQMSKELNCIGEIDKCISLKKITYLLEIFDEYFIKNQQYKKTVRFVDVFNVLCGNTRNNLTALVNDFEHIREHHIEQICTAIEHSIKLCNEIETCVCSKRSEFEYEINAFGLNDEYSCHEINIIKYMMKIHMFLSHKEGLQTEEQLSYNIRSMYMQRLTTKRTNVEQNYNSSKFVSEISEVPAKHTAKFELGERFYYWKYFKDGRHCKEDHFIEKPDFPNLKHEMLNNNIYSIPLKIWNLELKNAIIYQISNKGKSLRANNRSAENSIYEIPVDCPISISHLMTILFYTNHTELQHQFKKQGTRKCHKTDTLNDVKTRNKQIGNWYMLFYEVTQLFSGKTNKSYNYYHGLSIPLMFDSFNPIFNAPISTSTSIYVAARFANNGIILCLMATFESLGCLDVSWLSNYSEEQERLFGHEDTLFINDIRFNDHKYINFNHSNLWYIRAFRLFDSIFCANKFYSHKQTNRISQIFLIALIRKYYYKSLTMVDNIMEYINDNLNIKNKLNINKYIFEQEYDSDAINCDIDIDDNSSNICQQFTDSKQYELFRFFVNRQTIPKYLQDLFKYKLEAVKCKKQKIFVIKSEYKKLKNKLKRELIKFNDDDDSFTISSFLSSLIKPENIVFMNECTWDIEGDQFITFLQSKTGQLLNGPQCSLQYFDGSVLLRPEIVRSDSSWPDYASVAIRILSLPPNIDSVSIGWSYVVLKPKYLSTQFITTLKQGEQVGYQSFKSKSLTKMDNNIHIKLCIRILTQK